MHFRTLFRQPTTKYDGNHDTPTPGGASLRDVLADRLRGGHAETPNIVFKWRRLEQFDPKSPEYLLILTSLLDDRMDRKATTSLEGEDATTVLDILARVLEHGRNLGGPWNRTLRVLRSLAYNSCQVPYRYRVDRSLVFEINPVAFASGGFSDVRKGNLGGQLVAVKVMRMALDKKLHELQKHFCKETVLWKNISHPNILGLIAVEIDGCTGNCSMISELMTNGNIFIFIQSSSVNRLRLLADAAEGLQYLHDRKLIHGDIKGSNILITNGIPPRACLSDFGFSTPAPTKSFVMTTHGTNLAGGTTLYMAPELAYPSKFGLHRLQLSREGDIYAFGMVIYEIVMGIRPFGVEGYRVEEVMFAVIEGKRPGKPENVEAIGFGGGVWDLVERCWREDRTQRPKTWDVRLGLAVAASLSSSVPPGPRVAVSLAQENNTGSMTSSNYETPFGDGRQRTTPRDSDDLQATGSILDHPMLERSILVARRVFDDVHASILPTVRERFGVFEGLQIRKFIGTFRARFRLDSARAPRPH